MSPVATEGTLRIVVAAPAENAWSETFIAAHIDRLSKVELLVSGGVPPRNASHGGPLVRTHGLLAYWDRFVGKRFGGQPGLAEHRLAHRLERLRPDVVLAEYGNMGAEIVEACRSAGVPLVAHFHGFDAHRTDYIAQYGNYRELFRYASALVVVSRAMEAQLLRIGAPREKVVYNCYGIDVDRFTPGRPDLAPPHFLAVGRFAEKKAPHLTIRAFSQVVAQRPQARLTMVGQGRLWQQCRALVDELGLQESVDLCGVKTPDAIVDLMHASRAFVQHSVVTASNDHEGTPLAVLEAMASGVPVVSTRHAGIADVVAHEERGLLCAEHDVEAMAAHMIRLVDDPALALAMGTAGRAYTEKAHRVEVQVVNLQGILHQAVHRA
ncbi:MAG: glycosyltransferase [Flavobacteriales bacterium]|nr:MAG: glycosyltransferase [Flavobacteriales bacterium]